jgi:acetoin utilization deacetylase AcuC-like enzyme
MGFCLFNNVVIGAQQAVDSGLDRILVVDWDVHHGNGTQAMFWEDPRLAFMSIHRSPFYPGTGAENETGAGDGLGTILNLPVKFGTKRKDYLDRFTTELERFAAKIKPQLVLVSAGFDAHRRDPIGSLGLESDDFGPLTQSVLAIADAHADGKVVSVLEGGYNPEAVAESITVHLEKLVKD